MYLISFNLQLHFFFTADLGAQTIAYVDERKLTMALT